MLAGRAQRRCLQIYGRHDRVRLSACQAVWQGDLNRLLRVVAVEPLSGGRPIQAFYSTDASATAEQLLTRYARRWAIEQTFQETKSHLGFEQPQGWTRRSVERTAPTAMLIYTLAVAWFAEAGHRLWTAPQRPWYRSKRGPAFVDMLDTLRRESLCAKFLTQASLAQGAKNHTNLATGCFTGSLKLRNSNLRQVVFKELKGRDVFLP